eukprot:gb/GECG01016541.1/.p1 GENE.gb/GECG01016541.1/~~gb/GECG01016541.1/.p1  ORF type:complete len:120 (+),score=8.04 gb/GECG01016541.1/:1-360(+)
MATEDQFHDFSTVFLLQILSSPHTSAFNSPLAVPFIPVIRNALLHSMYCMYHDAASAPGSSSGGISYDDVFLSGSLVLLTDKCAFSRTWSILVLLAVQQLAGKRPILEPGVRPGDGRAL